MGWRAGWCWRWRGRGPACGVAIADRHAALRLRADELDGVSADWCVGWRGCELTPRAARSPANVLDGVSVCFLPDAASAPRSSCVVRARHPGFGFRPSAEPGFAPCPSRGGNRPQTSRCRTRKPRMAETRTRDPGSLPGRPEREPGIASPDRPGSPDSPDRSQPLKSPQASLPSALSHSCEYNRAHASAALGGAKRDSYARACRHTPASALACARQQGSDHGSAA